MGHKAPYQLPPLPPATEKIQTIATLKKATTATFAIAELKGIAETIPSQQMLVNAITLKEAKDSSEIENIITSTDELYEALATKDSAVKPQTKEVVNYRRSIMLGFDILKDQGFIRVNDIVNIQKDLLNNDAGIRSTPGTVLKNDATGEVVYTPPQDKIEIESLLSNFIKYYNDNTLRDGVPDLIWLAVLHFQFESIHPFYDGNGRTGRILNILFLIMNGMIDIPILYLSSHIIQNKPEYYRLLNQVNKTGEWEEWILFMLDAVERTAIATKRQILAIRSQLKEKIQLIKTRLPKIYSRELVELIFEQPYSKIEYVVDKLGVERKAASRYLRQLEEIGVLTSKRVGRETIYINVDLFTLLKK
ncbi:Fic family protein [Lewinella marina]|uniref:Addiction module protein n=1 Tax=Neolewinella marina TaxID=438751 RepID=A0A2G0CKI6_9BACT|nr:Fic family protein [Neolewinella marina]NJB84314.1 Fic family protein [Neolewinella marina]PHL00484.1 addiction module protein [Neolewinella marina]